MKIIAHRGHRSAFPENTAEAIQAVNDLPIDGVEFDVALTRDCVPVLIHQETLEPDPTGTRLVLATVDEARAWVSKMNARELQNLDAGSWFESSWSTVRVPTLAAVLSLMKFSRSELWIELIDPYYFRAQRDDREVKRHIEHTFPQLQLLSESGRKFAVLSFNPALLAAASRLPCPPKTVLNLWKEWQGRGTEAASVAAEAGAAALHVADCMLLKDPSWSAVATEAGLELYVYEASPALGEVPKTTREFEQLWDLCRQLGVHGLTTDAPEAAVQYRQRNS